LKSDWERAVAVGSSILVANAMGSLRDLILSAVEVEAGVVWATKIAFHGLLSTRQFPEGHTDVFAQLYAPKCDWWVQEFGP